MSSFELAALLILSVFYSILHIFSRTSTYTLCLNTFDLSARWICLGCCVEIVLNVSAEEINKVANSF